MTAIARRFALGLVVVILVMGTLADRCPAQEAPASRLAETVAQHVADEDPRMRRSVIELLHRLDPRPYEAVFMRALGDADHVVRFHAVSALGTLRAIDAVPALIDLAAMDANACGRVVTALGEIGGARAAAFLKEQLLNERSVTAYQAAQSLARLDGECAAGDAIAEALETRGAPWRPLFVPALSKCARSQHVELLEDLMSDEDPSVRFHVATALKRLGVTPAKKLASMEPTGDHVPTDVYWAACDQISSCKWREVAPSDLLEVIAHARLVFLAEAHGIPGVLAKQEEIVRGLTERWDQRAIGFEPPAQVFQQPVLDVARPLGWEMLALEEASAEPRPLLARDRDAIRRMRAWFEQNDDGRMVVLYGMAHVLGSGRFHEAMAHLKRVTILLESRDLYWRIVRSTGELDLSGKAYRIGEDLYYCPAQPPLYQLGADPLLPSNFVTDHELLRRVTTRKG